MDDLVALFDVQVMVELVFFKHNADIRSTKSLVPEDSCFGWRR
jgi:hypothetical protein